MSEPLHLTGAEQIAKERLRQIEEEHFDAAHDDMHFDAALVEAAAGLVFHVVGWGCDPEYDDDWSLVHKHGHDTTRCLVIAGAMIAAEIDRLARAKKAERERHLTEQMKKEGEELRQKMRDDFVDEFNPNGPTPRVLSSSSAFRRVEQISINKTGLEEIGPALVNMDQVASILPRKGGGVRLCFRGGGEIDCVGPLEYFES